MDTKLTHDSKPRLIQAFRSRIHWRPDQSEVAVHEWHEQTSSFSTTEHVDRCSSVYRPGPGYTLSSAFWNHALPDDAQEQAERSNERNWTEWSTKLKSTLSPSDHNQSRRRMYASWQREVENRMNWGECEVASTMFVNHVQLSFTICWDHKSNRCCIWRVAFVQDRPNNTKVRGLNSQRLDLVTIW